MAVVRHPLSFESTAPSIEDVIMAFRQHTGLELAAEPVGSDGLYSLESKSLTGDVELQLGDTPCVYRFRVRTGYLEAALAWTLASLGARISPDAIPKYARVPWATLPAYKRWIHR